MNVNYFRAGFEGEEYFWIITVEEMFPTWNPVGFFLLKPFFIMFLKLRNAWTLFYIAFGVYRKEGAKVRCLWRWYILERGKRNGLRECAGSVYGDDLMPTLPRKRIGSEQRPPVDARCRLFFPDHCYSRSRDSAFITTTPPTLPAYVPCKL